MGSELVVSSLYYCPFCYSKDLRLKRKGPVCCFLLLNAAMTITFHENFVDFIVRLVSQDFDLLHPHPMYFIGEFTVLLDGS